MSIEEMELLRKKANAIKRTGMIITCVLAFIVLIFCLFFIKDYFMSFMATIFIFVFGTVITLIAYSEPSGKINKSYKEIFVSKALKTVFSDLIYIPEKGTDENIIRETGMMYMGDRFSSSDFVSGKYKDVNVVQSDVRIEKKDEEIDKDGNVKVTWRTIFSGRWMVFDFNKSFKSNICVCQKSFSNSFIRNGSSYKKVELEAQSFNDKFRVYSQDEHEAFYILTPSFMEKIMKLSNNISGNLLFCFVNNKLHIGLESYDDSFEPDLSKTFNEEKIIKDISEDIKTITDFIDELNLDNHLFR